MRLMQADVYMVVNADTDEVAGVYLRKQRNRATNVASQLFHATGDRWIVGRG